MTDINLEYFFPTVIGFSYFENFIDVEQDLVTHCLNLKSNVESGGKNWLSNNTYNTSDNFYNIFLDYNFKDLNDWVCNAINSYKEARKIKGVLAPQLAWLNVYEKGDFQEYHKHPGSTISAVFFLKSPKNSSRIFFKNPVDDMYVIEFDEVVDNCYGSVYYDSEPGKLIIFPSNIPHAVEQHQQDKCRISLSYNYIQEF